MDERRSCTHKFRYYGVVGLAVPGHVVGTIDLWRCQNCGSIDANPRRIGDTKPPGGIGWNILEEDEKWAIITCLANNPPNNWELVRVKPGAEVHHECPSNEKSFVIGSDYSLSIQGNGKPHDHELYLAEDYMEKTILIVK